MFGWLRNLARKSTTSNPAAWFIDWIHGGEATSSSIRVTAESAERASAVYACVRVVSEDVAKLPLILYKRRADGGKDRAVDHPLYRMLHRRPNPWQTSYDFRQTMQRALELRGNAYGEKEKDGRGRVAAVWPLEPDTVTVRVNVETRALFYEVAPQSWNPGGKRRILPRRDVLHIVGPSDNGILGKSTITAAREAIGLALASEKHEAKVFGNGARLSGVLTHPMKLTNEAQDAILKDWKAKYQGAENSGKTALLAEGMKFEPVAMTNEDAQFLELRGAQTAEIARFFRIPPHKIADLSKATFSNIEHQALEYVTDSLLPRLVRWEQRLTEELLDEEEILDGYFFEFLVDGLLRGDIKSRYEALNIARNAGVINADEWREKENWNPIGGEEGEMRWRPANMVPADSPIAPPKDQPKPAEGDPPKPKAGNGLLREPVTAFQA